MKGYIVVGDDLQFQNQTVTVGETLQVATRFERTIFPHGPKYTGREDVVYRSYHDAIPHFHQMSVYSRLNGHDKESINTTMRPKYRAFECEVGGRVVPAGSKGSPLWYCDTITITKELTHDTPKANATSVSAVCMAHAYAFNQPFIAENVVPLLDKCYATLEQHTFSESLQHHHMTHCILGLVCAYGLKAQAWDGERALNTLLHIHDTYEHVLSGRGRIHLVDVLLQGYARNANFSVSERIRIRDEIRTWYQQSTHPYTAEEQVTMLHLDQFLDKLQAITSQQEERMFLNEDGTSWTPYWRMRDYIATATTSEIEQILVAQTTMGRPIAMRVTEFPSDISVDVLRAYIEHAGPSSHTDALASFAKAFPYEASVYDTTYAILERIKRGDTDTMYQHIKHPLEYIRGYIAYYGTDDMREQLMKDKAVDVRALVASTASEDIVRRMVGDRSATVRIEIAYRGIDEALDGLVHDTSSNVRHAVLDNARPQDVEMLRNDTLGTIRKRAERAFTTN